MEQSQLLPEHREYKRSEEDRFKLTCNGLMRGFDRRPTGPDRFGYQNVIKAERADKAVIRVTILNDGRPDVLYIPAKQLTQGEILALREYAMNGKAKTIESFSDAKPKVESRPKLSGLEVLEARIKPKEPEITEAVRDIAVIVPEVKYRPVRVKKSYTVTYEEEYILKMTEKTLEEYAKMQEGTDDDRFVFAYLLNKQCNKQEPAITRKVKEDTPVFEVVSGVA